MTVKYQIKSILVGFKKPLNINYTSAQLLHTHKKNSISHLTFALVQTDNIISGIDTHMQEYTHTYVYMYVCMFMCILL